MEYGFYILLFIIKNINAQKSCDEKCEICSSTSETLNNECEKCINNAYMEESSKYCFYKIEKPNFYIDEALNILKPCTLPCYECLDNSINNCLSCQRGYTLNEETKQCIECPTDNYIFILDQAEECHPPEHPFFCKKKRTECTQIKISDNFECPREYPILIESYGRKECVLEYQPSNYIISNKIIKTQWLNNMIHLGIDEIWYMTTDYSSNNDLIIESHLYNETDPTTDRFFYAIRSNGRPLFYDNYNKKYTNYKQFTVDTTLLKFESQLIKIKLFNNGQKDYYLNIGFSNTLIEIVDFYENKIYSNSLFKLTGVIHWSSKYFSLLELRNENNVYMFCFIGEIENEFYVVLQKYKFYKEDISLEGSYEKINSSKSNDEMLSSRDKTINCIEIQTLNVIQCLYINKTNYFIIGIYNESSLEVIKLFNIVEAPVNFGENREWDNYHQIIHLKEEVSVIGYFLDLSSNLIYIQIKQLKYKYNKFLLENYFLKNKTIIINQHQNFTYVSFFYTSHLKKLNDNKFSLISASSDSNELYIITFDIYNFHDTNLMIRYYNIPLKLYNIRVFQFISSINYKGFLGIIYTTRTLLFEKVSQYFSIFSYINSIDSELISLESNTKLNLSDFINSNCIENNIFGVNLSRIKILKLPNSKSIGVYYFSQMNNTIISENDLLLPEDEIIFIYDYDNIVKNGSIYTIEIAGVTQEPTYSDFNKYPVYSEFIGKSNQESFYNQRIFIGKSGFYNFTIPTALVGSNDNSCRNNCKICYIEICIKCINGYTLSEDTNECLSNIPTYGYYFDKKSETIKKCHEACKTCLNGPIYYEDRLDIFDTNCDLCKDNYYKIINTNNCIYKDTQLISFYLDINKGFFYKCYENCMTCNQFKKNSTYLNCLSCDENSLFYEKSSNCLDCVLRDKFVNYYQYDCIDFIPDGYYLLNEKEKTIDMCYKTCKSCLRKGNSNNHNCIECADAYPFNYNNGQKCLDDCSKENLFVDEEDKKCYIDCKNNINKRKYNYKEKCISENDNPKNYKLVRGNNNFISICDPKRVYEFNNECYEKCPEGTKLDESVKKKNICICNNLYYLKNEEMVCINSNVCPDNYPFLKIGTSECSNCPVKYKGECYLSCPENTCITQINENLATCVDKLDETKILGGICFDDFIKILDDIENVESNKNIVINNNPGITINIYQDGMELNEIKNKYTNLTFIQLGQCTEKLIEYYNLSKTEKLFIISMDSYTKVSTHIINDFNFEVYIQNGTQLEDLSICKNIIVFVSSPIINEDLAHLKEAQVFQVQGYNIYNLSSEFYTEKCSAANINGNDITIEDRIIEIYPYNITFCPQKCELQNVDIDSQRLNCNCNISFINYYSQKDSNIENKLNGKSEENFFIYLLDMLNYKIFACPSVLSKSKIEDYKNNSGIFIGTGVIIIIFINSFIFTHSFLNQIRIDIFKLIPNDKLYYNKNTSQKILKSKIKRFSLNKRIGKSKFKKLKNEILKAKPGLASCKENPLINLNIDENNKIDKDEYNQLPFSKALRLDKRDIFSIYISLIKMKIEILSILFFPEKFTHFSVTFSTYLLDFLFCYFMNALLYSDDVVSQKYHNNGKLNFITSVTLSLISNIISNLFLWMIKRLTSYHEYLLSMTKEIKRKEIYILTFQKLYKLTKITIYSFFIISFIISIFITYYLSIFCIIYQKSQISLLMNYIIGLIESLISSVLISFLISVLRYIGLKYKYIKIYRTSVYLDQKY